MRLALLPRPTLTRLSLELLLVDCPSADIYSLLRLYFVVNASATVALFPRRP